VTYSHLNTTQLHFLTGLRYTVVY